MFVCGGGGARRRGRGQALKPVLLARNPALNSDAAPIANICSVHITVKHM